MPCVTRKPAGLYTAWMVFGQKLIIGLTMSVFGSSLTLTGYILRLSRQLQRRPGLHPAAHHSAAGHPLQHGACRVGDLRPAGDAGWPDRGAHLQGTAG